MKKIGIMTWFRYQNYGTALQATAIFTKIEELGYKPQLIDYAPKGGVIENHKITASFVEAKIANKLKNCCLKKYISKERTALFSKYLTDVANITEQVDTFPELQALNSEFDAFVCGSDQIWAPSCYDDKYFLSFVDCAQNMVAYAPSIGLPNIKNGYIKQNMARLISRFEHLSIREQQGSDIIKQLCERHAEVVVDPTLLLSASEWKTFLEDQRSTREKKIDGDYIICYFLGDYRGYIKAVKRMSEKFNMPAYVIPIFARQENKIPFEVGPVEFVDLIRNAKYVCTDSFHGIAFSINFNIPFTAFKRFKDKDPQNQNSRIINILEAVGLQDRIIDRNSSCFHRDLLKCEFSRANEILGELRAHSIDYLKNALEKAVKAVPEKKRNSEFKITDLCCGCGACATVCSQEAITIMKNDNGFEHYTINQGKCIRCGKCKSVCSFLHISATPIKNAENLYSFKSSNNEVLEKSSSGGIAFELAKLYNQQGYWVSGSAYLKELDIAKHVLIAPLEGERLPELQGSKYIQSITSDTFAKIEKLDKNEKIIFFGTPCQVAGIDKVLVNTGMRENAILVDLICHGVPSQLVWVKHLEEIRKKYNIEDHPDVIFRTKKVQWHSRYMKIFDSKNCYEESETKDNFYAIFRRGLCYMNTCFECPYREKSAADIRIGDYWGERFADDAQGVSMVIANNSKGNEIIQKLKRENKVNISKQVLREYWTVQYPYNQQKPLFSDKMIADVKNPELTLSQIRKKYCSIYDFNEFVGKQKKLIKKILGMEKIKNERKI